MTSYIVNVLQGDTGRGDPRYFSLFAVGLTLFVITFLLNAISRVFVARYPGGLPMSAVSWTSVASGQLHAKWPASAPPMESQPWQSGYSFPPLRSQVCIACLADSDPVPRMGRPWMELVQREHQPNRIQDCRRQGRLLQRIDQHLMGCCHRHLFSIPIGLGAAIYLEEYAPENVFTRISPDQHFKSGVCAFRGLWSPWPWRSREVLHAGFPGSVHCSQAG